MTFKNKVLRFVATKHTKDRNKHQTKPNAHEIMKLILVDALWVSYSSMKCNAHDDMIKF